MMYLGDFSTETVDGFKRFNRRRQELEPAISQVPEYTRPTLPANRNERNTYPDRQNNK